MFVALVLYLTIAAAFVADYVDLLRLLGPAARLVPLATELGSGLLFVMVMLEIGRNKQLHLSPKYLLIGVLILAHFALGSIVNSMSSGAFLAGLRDYVKFLPLFLVPAAFNFSEKDLARLFKFLLVMCFIQFPVCLYQRLLIYPDSPTGDVVRGTLPSGSMTTILMVTAIAMLGALRLRGRISTASLIGALPILLLPTFLNETKASIFLLGVAVIALAWQSSSGAQRLRRLSAAGLLSILFVATYFVSYEVFFPEKFGDRTLVGYYSDIMLRHEYSGKIGDADEAKARIVPRTDTIVFSYKLISDDFASLAFGLGIGNVASPKRFKLLRGAYSEYFVVYDVARTTYGYTILETGIVGLLLVLVLSAMVLRDAAVLSRAPGLRGVIGLGWFAALAMLPVIFFYKSLVHASVPTALLMLLSGLVAALRFRESFSSAPEAHPIAQPENDRAIAAPERQPINVRGWSAP